MDITQQQDVNGKLEHQGFSEQERQTWGDGVCETLEGIGAYPALPTWKPEGYLPFDVTHMDDTDGYAYITALYLVAGRGTRRVIKDTVQATIEALMELKQHL